MVDADVALPLTNSRLADKLLTDYIHFFSMIDPRPGKITYIGCLISVLEKLHPSLSRNIHLTRRAINTWKLRHESRAGALINSVMGQSFAFWLIRQGNADVAIALIVAQAAFLRPSEIASLQWRDVLFRGDPVFKEQCPKPR